LHIFFKILNYTTFQDPRLDDIMSTMLKSGLVSRVVY